MADSDQQGRGARILVIDDEEGVRELIADALRTAGYHVVEAGDGAEGLAILADGPIDVVVTDMIMPRKEGIETIVELKRAHPEIGVVAISGGGRTKNYQFLELAKSLGADSVLQKPFTVGNLLEQIEVALSARGNGAP